MLNLITSPRVPAHMAWLWVRDQRRAGCGEVPADEGECSWCSHAFRGVGVGW